MKKFLLSMVAAAATATMFAQVPSITPSQGSVNTTDDSVATYTPGGLSSICLNVSSGVINRECEGFVTLYYNGEAVAALPASNERRVYCESGYSKYLESGDIRFDFSLESVDTTPYKENGTYTLEVPENLYTLRGIPNSAFTAEWTISDQGTTLALISNPESGSTVETVSQIEVTFQGAIGVELTNTSLLELNLINSSKQVVAIPYTARVSGNVLTVTPDEPIEEAGTLTLVFGYNSGSYAVTVVTANGLENIDQTLRYTLMGKQQASSSDMVITPAPGTYSSIPMTDYQIDDETTASALFCIELPENTTFQGYNSMAYIMIRDAAGNDISSKGNLYVISNTSTIGGNKVYIYAPSYSPFKDAITYSSGEYYLYIPDNCVKVSVNGGSNSAMASMTFGPYIFSQSDDAMPTYTISPANGAEVEELNEIVITFDEGAQVDWDLTNRWVTMTSGIAIYDMVPDITDNVVTFSFPVAVTTPGTYELYIPGTVLQANSFPISIDTSFSIAGGNDTPESNDFAIYAGGVKVDVTFMPADEENDEHWYANAVFGSSDDLQIQVVPPTGYNEVYYYTAGVAAVPASLTPSTDILEAGYVLAENGIVPVQKGVQHISICYGVDGQCAEPMLLKLEANIDTAVDTVDVADGVAEYYTLQGVKVANPEKGIYIKVQNGKAEKVLVK